MPCQPTPATITKSRKNVANRFSKEKASLQNKNIQTNLNKALFPLDFFPSNKKTHFFFSRKSKLEKQTKEYKTYIFLNSWKCIFVLFSPAQLQTIETHNTWNPSQKKYIVGTPIWWLACRHLKAKVNQLVECCYEYYQLWQIWNKRVQKMKCRII